MSRLVKSVYGSFAATLALSLFAPSALAEYTDADEARAAIVATAEQAVEEIRQVVAEFESAAKEMNTTAEVDAAATAAQRAVTTIAQEAKAEINNIQSQYPSQLAQVANAERNRIQEAKQNAFNEIKTIKVTYPAPATTTTTLPPETTTSTEKTAESAPQPPATPPPTDPITQPSDIDVGASRPPLLDPANQEPLGSLAPGLSLNRRAGDGTDESTEIRFAGLRLVLPPAIAEFIATPLEIMKLLLRTTLDGGRILLVPIFLLVGSCGLLVLVDRRRRDPPLARANE